MRPYVLEPLRIGRIHVEPHDIFRAHARIGENGERILPDLIVLRFEALRNAPVRSDAHLSSREEPACIWRHLDAMAVLGGRRRDRGWIASLEHDERPPMIVQCEACLATS